MTTNRSTHHSSRFASACPKRVSLILVSFLSTASVLGVYQAPSNAQASSQTTEPQIPSSPQSVPLVNPTNPNPGLRAPLPANTSPQLRTPLPNTQAGFVLADSTPIKLRFKETISSETAQENQMVQFEVVEDVVLNGVTVISRGAIARGIVTEVSRAKMLGRKGKLNIILKEVQLTSGERVALRASTAKGGGISGGAIALSVIITPLFLLMGGRDAKYPAGTEFSAYVDGDYALEQSRFALPNTPMTPMAPN
jgi:hypothetical protein